MPIIIVRGGNLGGLEIWLSNPSKGAHDIIVKMDKKAVTHAGF